MMERILAPENLAAAWKRVKANKGAPGIDGMTVEAFPAFCPEHWPRILTAILEGTYRPARARRVFIPKPDGTQRPLDRLIQQAMHQVLSPVWEPDFSNHSYGFRPGRGAHQAVEAARAHVESRRRWVVDIDPEKFFDRVNHDVLMARVARRIKDKRMLRLMRRYLQSGIMEGGLAQPREEGTPQGGPLTPQTHLVNSSFRSACLWCDGIGT